VFDASREKSDLLPTASSHCRAAECRLRDVEHSIESGPSQSALAQATLALPSGPASGLAAVFARRLLGLLVTHGFL